MIILWFVAIQFALIGFYDVWQMRAEYKYWIKAGYDQAASDWVSVGQFIFWYAEVLLGLFFVAENPYEFGTTFASILFLHYAGLEDWFYYFFQRFVKLPDQYWKNRKFEYRWGWQFPSTLYWLAVPRKVAWITVKPLWITYWAGVTVSLDGFLRGVVAACMIVIASGVLLWLALT